LGHFKIYWLFFLYSLGEQMQDVLQEVFFFAFVGGGVLAGDSLAVVFLWGVSTKELPSLDPAPASSLPAVLLSLDVLPSEVFFKFL
jgi:hypothetical protein